MTRAVVVGSGPNGLSAALTLALAGLSVTVYEAADWLGGGCRSSELTLPGLIHDECAAAHPLSVENPFVRELGLQFDWRWPGVQYAHPLDGGRGAVAFRMIRDTVVDLGVERWRTLFEPLASRFREFSADVLGPVLRVPRHPVDLGRLGLRAALPASAIARWLDDERAAALWAGAAAHAFRPLGTVGSSAIGVMLGTAAHSYGWPVARGGSGALVEEMARRGRELGVSFECGRRVASLEELRPFDVAMLDLAPAGALSVCASLELPGRVRRGLSSFRHGPGAFKVDWAVEGEVPWAYEPARWAGTVHVGGSFQEIAAAEAAVCRGRMPERPFVLVCQQSVCDGSRELRNARPIYAYAHVPAGWPGDATRAIEAQIERFAPGFRDRILARAVRGVAATEAYNANYIGGDIITGANDPWQLVFRPRPALDPYWLGVPGVYLCSAATPPGAGAHGMCGWNAARSALRRL